jgi:hypothetical protein
MKRRKARTKQRRKSRRRTVRAAPPPAPPAPSEAERRLLALACDLAALGADPLPRAIDLLAAAYAPEAPLPSALQRAWLAGRGNKAAVLALAWAREQVRVAVEEMLRTASAGHVRAALGVSVSTHAWLVLAACEALAQEPPSAVPDRVRALAELTGTAR